MGMPLARLAAACGSSDRRSCRARCHLKPIVPRQLGSRGPTLAAGGRYDDEPWNATDDRFVEPASRVHRSLWIPADWQGGIRHVVAFGHPLLQTSSDGQARRQEGVAPSHPHQGTPDPGEAKPFGPAQPPLTDTLEPPRPPLGRGPAQTPQGTKRCWMTCPRRFRLLPLPSSRR